MWIARDKNIKYVHNNTSNHLWLYITDKPTRMSRAYNPNLDDMDYTGCWLGANSSMMPIDDSLFPELKWEDEPIEVEFTITKVNRQFIKCNKCGQTFSYLPKDIKTMSICTQPSSEYEEDFNFVFCPHCNGKVYLD